MRIIVVLLGIIISTESLFGYLTYAGTSVSCQAILEIPGDRERYTLGEVDPGAECRVKVGEPTFISSESCFLDSTGLPCTIAGVNPFEESVQPSIVSHPGFEITGNPFCIKVTSGPSNYGQISRGELTRPAPGEICDHTIIVYRYVMKNEILVEINEEVNDLTWSIPGAIGALEQSFHCTVVPKDDAGFFPQMNVMGSSGSLDIADLKEVTIECNYKNSLFSSKTVKFTDKDHYVAYGNNTGKRTENSWGAQKNNGLSNWNPKGTPSSNSGTNLKRPRQSGYLNQPFYPKDLRRGGAGGKGNTGGAANSKPGASGAGKNDGIVTTAHSKGRHPNQPGNPKKHGNHNPNQLKNNGTHNSGHQKGSGNHNSGQLKNNGTHNSGHSKRGGNHNSGQLKNNGTHNSGHPKRGGNHNSGQLKNNGTHNSGHPKRGGNHNSGQLKNNGTHNSGHPKRGGNHNSGHLKNNGNHNPGHSNGHGSFKKNHHQNSGSATTVPKPGKKTGNNGKRR